MPATEALFLPPTPQIMSASSKGPEKLGLDQAVSRPDDFPASSGAILSPEEDEAGAMKHSESQASILSDPSAQLASRASQVKTKLFDVWKGNWGFGHGSSHEAHSPTGSASTEAGLSPSADSRGTSPSKSLGREMDSSPSPSVEHLSLDARPDPASLGAGPESTTRLSQDDFGFPHAVFERGYLCLPYASLQHLDVITNPLVRGFLVGATNVLFQQKRPLADVVITVENAAPAPHEERSPEEPGEAETENRFEMEWRDGDLKRLVTLTTADLRFADEVLRRVEAAEDDGAWEGGDEWIRAQVKTYLQSMLVTALRGDPPCLHDFNAAFVFAWQNATRNYLVWRRGATGPEAWPGLDAVGESTHPGASPHLSVNDIKLKVRGTSEGGS